MELFLLLSGMGLVHSLGKDNRLGAFYYRRAIRILPALFLAYVAIHLSSGKSWIYSFGCMGWNWWYIRGLFFYYMVAPFLYRFFGMGRSVWRWVACLAVPLMSMGTAQLLSAWNAGGILYFWRELGLNYIMVLFMVFAFGMWLATAHPGFRWSKGTGLMGLLCVVFCLYYGQIPYPNSLWEGCYGTLLAFGSLFAADALSCILPMNIFLTYVPGYPDSA